MLIDVAEGRASLDEFMAQLTDLELAELLGGQPNTGVANTFGFGNQMCIRDSWKKSGTSRKVVVEEIKEN